MTPLQWLLTEPDLKLTLLHRSGDSVKRQRKSTSCEEVAHPRPIWGVQLVFEKLSISNNQ